MYQKRELGKESIGVFARWVFRDGIPAMRWSRVLDYLGQREHLHPSVATYTYLIFCWALVYFHLSFECTVREHMRLMEQEFSGLPTHLVVLLIISTVLSILGGQKSSGELKPISLADAPQYVIFFWKFFCVICWIFYDGLNCAFYFLNK